MLIASPRFLFCKRKRRPTCEFLLTTGALYHAALHIARRFLLPLAARFHAGGVFSLDDEFDIMTGGETDEGCPADTGHAGIKPLL